MFLFLEQIILIGIFISTDITYVHIFSLVKCVCFCVCECVCINPHNLNIILDTIQLLSGYYKQKTNPMLEDLRHQTHDHLDR